MRTTVLAWLVTTAGCVPMEPSGHPFEPASAPASTPAPGPAVAGPVAPAPAAGDFDFDAEDRGEPEGAGSTDPIDLQARLLGVDADLLRTPAPPAPEGPAVVQVPSTPVPVWDPSKPLPEAMFGVRVLATLLDMQPPRAVLGLPSGQEQVVQPGAMLPEEGLVVLAVGRDAVQLAKITPQGFYAAVRTETVRALYPASAAPGDR